jgi:GNAT superfamily N-acetyltransferase
MYHGSAHARRLTRRSTIRRTGRLDTPSMPVSSSAFPALPHPSWRMRLIVAVGSPLARGGKVLMQIRRYRPDDLSGILHLCEAEHWPSFPEDPARANRALNAPGVTTMVAIEDNEVVGFAQMQSDGEVQAHLSMIAVEKGFRGRGIARKLITAALREAGGSRVDLVTNSAEGFYSKLPHRQMLGFRLYPSHGC